MNYTHNLKILLFDDNNNIIDDEPFLDYVKDILCKSNTNVCNWNGKQENFIIKWNKQKLNAINQHFMGDLFSYPMYDFDIIVFNHTQETISKIKSKYNIKFHIFKIIGDKKIYKETCGIV